MATPIQFQTSFYFAAPAPFATAHQSTVRARVDKISQAVLDEFPAVSIGHKPFTTLWTIGEFSDHTSSIPVRGAENAEGHFRTHGAQFHYRSADDYVIGVHNYLNHPPVGTQYQVQTSSRGTNVAFLNLVPGTTADPSDPNYLAFIVAEVLNADDGHQYLVPRTMFRPDNYGVPDGTPEDLAQAYFNNNSNPKIHYGDVQQVAADGTISIH